jgi:DNA modification methylase
VKPYYEHGGIQIFNADCREVLPALADTSVDFIFTDPPYGHNNNDNDLIQKFQRPGNGQRGYVKGVGRPIANDGAEANDLVRWAFAEFRRLLLPGCCCCCCCGGGGPDPQFARWSLWLAEVLDFKQMVVWDKGPMGMGWHYRRSYETVLVAERPGAACRWFDETDRVENIIRHIRKQIPQSTDHPTPKPVALARHFINLHTQPGDLVLDPFMGGGSTLLAAKSAGRRAVGVELEEPFCEMTAKRLQQQVLPLFEVETPQADRQLVLV